MYIPINITLSVCVCVSVRACQKICALPADSIQAYTCIRPPIIFCHVITWQKIKMFVSTSLERPARTLVEHLNFIDFFIFPSLYIEFVFKYIYFSPSLYIEKMVAN